MIHKIKAAYKFFSPKFQNVFLEYKVQPKPRHHNKPHSLLYEIINANRDLYKKNLEYFLTHTETLQSIKQTQQETNENNPVWNNGFLPGLDMVAIYGMIAKHKPATYIEIGSGNSTKVARKAIKEQHLNTVITSIDPFPRTNIDHLADKVMRVPFENLQDNNFIIDSLKEDDILFIDNSHRVFPNSDAMICFLELLPYLKKGVIVHIHDIYIPYDYPQFMCDRFYNEQYVLAAFVLANPQKYKPILPNYFISEDAELAKSIAPLWNHAHLQNVEKHGGSFWLQIQ
ncbi:MAG: class I SAM-dependent methyltransferase [Bacteroidetes bacterium]|nr:class I SAM-dependent methyltransferase [Bacteroidota bacterium]